MTVGYPNPDEWATGRLSAAPRLTVLTSKSGPLTKSYEAAENGGVRRVSAPLSISSGVAQIAELQAATADAALEKLRQGVSKFTGSMALMTGCPVGEGKEWEIVPKGKEDIAQRKISRSKDYFRGVEGPALLALDFDVKEYPEHIREKLEGAGGLETVIGSVFPSIGGAARLILPSASSYIRNAASGHCTGKAGEHWYFVVSDGRETSKLADLIADHLEANGWCWGHVTKNGNVIVKTLIDRAATAPERIMYEAAPVLGPGLENSPEKAPRLIEGGVLDAESIAPIDADLCAHREQHRQAEKARVAQEAEKRREEWKAERVSDLIERGVDPEKARRTAEAAAGCELMGDFPIKFDDGSSATVREILADPNGLFFGVLTGPDPIEPEYGGGKNIAVLQTGYPAQIYSQAHGGTIYRLVDDPADYFEPVEFEAAQPEVDGRRSRFFSASLLQGRAIPPRKWLVPDLIPQNTVTLFGGDGGTGKSLLALQLAAGVAAGSGWLTKEVEQGGAIFISAEDDEDELHRRLADVVRAEGKTFADLARLTLRSLAGEDALLAVETNLTLVKSTLYEELDARAESEKPSLIVIDTLADVYPSNENDRIRVRQFVGFLRNLALRHKCAVVLLAHPSLSGLNSGSGMSGSTAWNNSVRSRLYLSRITRDGNERDPDKRILATKKANYGRVGDEITLRWRAGVFEVAARPSHDDEDTDAAHEGMTKVERIFLAILKKRNEQQRWVSHSPCPTYAPTQFEAEPEAEGIRKSAFADAMNSLFARGLIKVEAHGGGKKGRTHIAIVEPDGGTE